MWLHIVFQLLLLLFVLEKCEGISSPISPFTTYKHSIELEENVADLWWTVDDAELEIMFELHVKTTGWIALGISPAGGMKGADIGIGWIDHRGKVHFQDRYAFSNSRPVVDNTTTDWFALQGSEHNGWTAIQFKRLLDTCDSMDVPIKSGTNVLIFAFGLVDPDLCQPNGDISYHDTRRGSRMIPLRSYGDPPPDDKFAGLDSFEFRLNNYLIPSEDTTYHCKVYKAETRFPIRRHVIARKTLIDPVNRDLAHHMIVYECDPTVIFDNNNLPDGICDEIVNQIRMCVSNTATSWAIGGDDVVEYPPEAGYPVGGDFEIKYYMIQMHYDNPRLASNRRDNSGIRFYIGNDLRQYDLGYLSFGLNSDATGIAIPPQVEQFMIDSYCPAGVTQNFPQSGITVVAAFPHTHLQGQSVWTKIIRNNRAVQYLFNGEEYDFNYQFENRLPKPIKLYPGDEFATRCIYNTMNKKEITLGGERTKDEMCLHMFPYYPRMSNLSSCITLNSESAWKSMMNSSSPDIPMSELKQWLRSIKWTPELATSWQEFYNNASRIVYFGKGRYTIIESFASLLKYEDLKPAQCTKGEQNQTNIVTMADCNSAICQQTFIVLAFIPLIMIKVFIA